MATAGGAYFCSCGNDALDVITDQGAGFMPFSSVSCRVRSRFDLESIWNLAGRVCIMKYSRRAEQAREQINIIKKVKSI